MHVLYIDWLPNSLPAGFSPVTEHYRPLAKGSCPFSLFLGKSFENQNQQRDKNDLKSLESSYGGEKNSPLRSTSVSRYCSVMGVLRVPRASVESFEWKEQTLTSCTPA